MRRIEFDLRKFDILILNHINFDNFNINNNNYNLIIKNIDTKKLNDLSYLQNIKRISIKCECVIGKNVTLPKGLQNLTLENITIMTLKKL